MQILSLVLSEHEVEATSLVLSSLTSISFSVYTVTQCKSDNFPDFSAFNECGRLGQTS